MVESHYTFRDLTADNALDALELQEKISGKFSRDEKVLFIDLTEEVNEEAGEIGGAQNGFVVYDQEVPIAYLGISEPFVDDEEIPGLTLLTQELGGFVTDPEYRSLSLLNSMLRRVLSTQDPGFIYCYSADALLDTSYKGLSKAGVQKWLRKNGYSVVLKDNSYEEEIDNDRYGKSNPVFLYPSFLDAIADVVLE